MEISIGSDLGWTDGICYRPISGVRPSDVLTFSYSAHDVWRMPSMEAMDNCDFGSAIKLAGVGDAPFEYSVTAQDAMEGHLYFACSIGAHCSQGGQKISVNVQEGPAEEPEAERGIVPTSEYLLGADDSACALYQSGTTGSDTEEFLEANRLQSECTEAVLGEDGMYSVSCLSGPATLTPGGVMNSARFMHYPYPTDRRVVVGTNTWEFVQGDPIPNSNGQGVTPVPVNQLYVHHLSGRVVLGQGSEGIRRSDVQFPFPEPYGTLTGEEGDAMVFHIIDLREVDEWLACVECRCRDPEDGTYLTIGGSGDGTGGVPCCANCTDLAGPTIDYRMRYNVSYWDIPEEGSVTDLQMITADISPVVGKAIEFDVPSYENLKPGNVKEGMPRIQRLVREGPFDELFQMEFFGDAYAGPSNVKFFRCVGHLHIAALGMWLEDAETGMTICDGEGSYGMNPEQDKGFLTAVKVHSHDPPLEFPSDRRVRLITEYNATEFHTGVMGMWFAYVSSDVEVDREAAKLTVEYCENSVCDVDMLPEPPVLVCEDKIAENPMCRFGGLCDCKELVVADGSEGCGGVYSTAQGDIVINDVCAKHCGACGEEAAASSIQSGCVDALADGPMCSFGGMCECEDFVSAPESTGCGGVYTSDWGDIQVNDYCAKHCDACSDEEEGPSQEELLQKEMLKSLEDHVSKTCKYATPECHGSLSNLQACGTGQKLTGTRQWNMPDRKMAMVAREHGVRLAAEHAKLGDASLHRNEVESTVNKCEVPGITSDAQPASEADSDDSSGNPKLFGGIVVGVTFALIIGSILCYQCTKKHGPDEEEVHVEKAVVMGDSRRTVVSANGSSDQASDDSSDGSNV